MHLKSSEGSPPKHSRHPSPLKFSALAMDAGCIEVLFEVDHSPSFHARVHCGLARLRRGVPPLSHGCNEGSWGVAKTGN